MKKPSADNDFKITLQHSREAIWCNVMKLSLSDIDSSPFQPEDEGFILCSAIS